MAQLPIIAAGILGLVLAFVLGASTGGIVGFVILSVLAGFVATLLKPGSERVYWIAVGTVVLMIALSYFGFDINGFIFAAPIIFALAYFTARLARRFIGQNA